MSKEKIDLCKASDCTGCFACSAICSQNAISAYHDSEGFSHPQINHDTCISCKSCQRICPVLTPVERMENGKVYAAWALDDSIRQASSSGGIFSMLGMHIIQNGGMVIGAKLNNENGRVEHAIASSLEELQNLRGSKYVQSTISAELYRTILHELNDGKPILFTGTPCQVAGMQNLAKKKNHSLYTMDIVCHGVPSPAFFEKIYSSVKKKHPTMLAYNFRELKEWRVNANIDFIQKQKKKNALLDGLETLYQDAFLKGLLHRPNCYHCQYAGTQRIGDISVADFWGIGKDKPFHEDYKKGCSMVSVNSEKGRLLFKQIEANLFYEERDIEETIHGGNEQLKQSSVKPFGRDSFYKDAEKLSYKELVKKYHLKIRVKKTFLRTIKDYLIKLFIHK